MHGVDGDVAGCSKTVSADSVIEAFGFPAAIIDTTKKILHCNGLFADLLTTRAGERMWRRLEVRTGPDEAARIVLEIGDGSAGPRLVGLRRLTGCNQKAYLVTVSVAGPSALEEGQFPALAGDITAAEKAVLFGMLAGQTLAEIAQARGTKVTTVRWHLKNLQWKLGMTDKAEVVAWIARSPVCWLAREPDSRSDA